ncbi:hypothetical protein ACFL7D_06970 [candidate division KSB1 bacterium]
MTFLKNSSSIISNALYKSLLVVIPSFFIYSNKATISNKFFYNPGINKTVSILSLIFILLSVNPTYSQEYDFNETIEISDLEPGEIIFKEFALISKSKIRITGSAFGTHLVKDLIAYGWILNSESRETVWKMGENIISNSRRRNTNRPEIFEYDEIIDLPSGGYEIYFSTIDPGMLKAVSGLNAGRYRDLFRTFGIKASRDLPLTEVGITIEGFEDILIETKGNLENFKNNAVFSFSPVENNAYYRTAFTVSEKTDVRLYLLGEFITSDETGNDYGWILHRGSQKKIWELKRSMTEHAGGAEKNRVFDGIITLDPGEYIAFYMSDGSHSFNDWNEPPPSDPFFWGFTMSGTGERNDELPIRIANIETGSEPVVRLVELGDNVIAAEGFYLPEDTQLRVYSIGESNYSMRDMVDYGWIINAESKDLVWKMDYTATEYAGGHNKNRLFDQVIPFKSGSYIVYFRTDAGHSFNNWNETQPYDVDNWGITLHLADINLRTADIETFSAEDYLNDNTIVLINKVRDNKKLKRSFSLENPTQVEIYSVGEGEMGIMYDFGWIINNEDNSVVWEMTYNNTKNAGGSAKNRMCKTRLILEEGKYTVFFNSDESHSYENWNELPPIDPISWGISVSKVN